MRAALAMCLVVMACGDGGSSSELSRSEGPRAGVPPEPAKPKPVDLSLQPGLEMRRPLHDGNLTIVPILATGATSNVHYVTLTDGLARHEVTVREIARPPDFHVDLVRIRNRSHQPLFVMTGELIVDGMQDRVLAEDRIIEPGKTVRVAVRCVEQGREEGKMRFDAPGTLAELAIRQAVIHQTQTEVWAKVDELDQAHSLHPRTKTYRELAELQHTELAARRDRLVRALAALPDRGSLVGLAQVIDGKVVALERFANPELYGALETELVGSYVASDDGPAHEGRTLLPADVRAFAGQAGIATAASFTAVARP